MKTTRPIVILLALSAIAALPADASAYYHPTVGRFINRDPGSGRPAVTAHFPPRDPTGTNQYADGMNLYEYVRGNPVNLRDPRGLGTWGQLPITGHMERRWIKPKEPETILSELWEKSNTLADLSKKFLKDGKKDIFLNMDASSLNHRIDYLWFELKRSFAFHRGEIPADVEKKRLGPNLIIGTIAGEDMGHKQATKLAKDWVDKGSVKEPAKAKVGRPTPRPHTGPVPWDPKHPGHVDRKIRCMPKDSCCVLSGKIYLFKAMLAAHAPVSDTHALEINELTEGLSTCIGIHRYKCTNKRPPIKIPVPVFVRDPVKVPIPISPKPRLKPLYGVPGGLFPKRMPKRIPIPIWMPIRIPVPISIPL
ncbi:MAG: hypothetical protein ISS69_16755 [Phycisphaerae bacterium]|nr:hypothetical protein [Phycisphaerae bacterium]